jgi:hypothetical protein
MKKILMLCLVLGCRGETAWEGVPENIDVHCGTFTDNVATCIGGGQIFKCVRSPISPSSLVTDYVITCAPSTPTPSAERP